MSVKKQDYESYQRTQMQRELVIQKLREKGCRITKQRLTLLDIILEEDCSCCKEIYYKALKQDSNIGTATVYRMVNILEEIGAISRKNMYRVNYSVEECNNNSCTVEFDDGTACYLSGQKWYNVLKAGLESCGYLSNQEIAMITINH